MNINDLKALYLSYVSGAQTTEKHVRWYAEKFARDFNDGFSHHAGGSRSVTWLRDDGEIRTFNVRIPAGMHGFALRLVIEDQIREGLR